MPHPRLGPRPLPLHLGTALMTWASSESAWQLWKRDSPSSKPASTAPEGVAEILKEVAALEAAPAGPLRAGAPSRDRPAHGSPGRGRGGLSPHPVHRTLRTAAAAWQEGNTRLLDYGRHASPPRRKRGARAVLVVPSLINRWEVLDLTAEKSLLRAMAAHGPAAVPGRLGHARCRGAALRPRRLCRAAGARRRLSSASAPPRAGGDGLLHGRHARRGARRAPAAQGGEARAARRAVGLPCRQDRPGLPALGRALAGASWPTSWASCRSMCCRPCSGRSIRGSR